jgi:hypothetical protein
MCEIPVIQVRGQGIITITSQALCRTDSDGRFLHMASSSGRSPPVGSPPHIHSCLILLRLGTGGCRTSVKVFQCVAGLFSLHSYLGHILVRSLITTVYPGFRYPQFDLGLVLPLLCLIFLYVK